MSGGSLERLYAQAASRARHYLSSNMDADMRQGLQQYMKGRTLLAPAFEADERTGFSPSSHSRRVLSELREISGKDFSLRPAYSVEANNGVPIWGGGGGYVKHSGGKIGEEAVVDPFEGTAFVVAHEGAHAVMPTKLNQRLVEGSLQVNQGALEVPRESGARLRYVHEAVAKPTLAEEAHAQGVAKGVMDRLGLPAETGEWEDLMAYPMSYATKGLEVYGSNEIGPPSPGEMKEVNRIINNTPGFLERMYRQGYAATGASQ